MQRVKKKHWKATYNTANAKVQTLHQKLIDKQAQIAALEERIRCMECELQLLGAFEECKVAVATDQGTVFMQTVAGMFNISWQVCCGLCVQKPCTDSGGCHVQSIIDVIVNSLHTSKSVYVNIMSAWYQ